MVPLLAGALLSMGGVASADSSGPKGRVMLIGSSSVNDAFGDIFVDRLKREGYEVERRGFPAAGLSRPDFHDMPAALSKVPVGPKATTVVLYVGGNDAQALWLSPKERKRGQDAWVKWGDDRWTEIYESRARRLIDDTCERGAKRVLVLPPVDVRGPKMQRKLERVREAQRRAAQASKCGEYISTSGDEGTLTASKPALRDQQGVHMTHAGATRVWGRIEKRLKALIATAAASG